METCDRLVELRGHLIDTGLMSSVLDVVTTNGGSFEVETFEAGARRDDESRARVRISAPSPDTLDKIVTQAVQLGAHLLDDLRDAELIPAPADGVAPPDFYSTTIFPTDVRIHGNWVRANRQRMDTVLVVRSTPQDPASATCTLFRDLRKGDLVVCGIEGIRIHAQPRQKSDELFAFMSSGVSSERRVEIVVEKIAKEIRQIRQANGKIVVVAGPVVVHTGGGPYLASLIRSGYVDALLGGNAIAVHDIEHAIYGTSLGVDLARGNCVHGGHRHHLKAINLIRRHGGIAPAVASGALTSGIMFECVSKNVPFVLAGSIRDDGPLPETVMDLIEAQRQYAESIRGADMILMLCSMLHSIGTGNMTPAGVKLICVDISPAVVTKLADRGSVESTGIVTDVGLFLKLLEGRLNPTN